MKKVFPFPVDLPIAQAVLHDAKYTMEICGVVWIDPETDELAVGVERQTECIMNEIKETLEKTGWDMQNITKARIFLANLDDFDIVNKIYASYFNGEYPTRFALQVAALPLDAAIEIECVAVGDTIKE